MGHDVEDISRAPSVRLFCYECRKTHSAFRIPNSVKYDSARSVNICTYLKTFPLAAAAFGIASRMGRTEFAIKMSSALCICSRRRSRAPLSSYFAGGELHVNNCDSLCIFFLSERHTKESSQEGIFHPARRVCRLRY